jgi:membrane fusion protein (multidrug efflux system)
MHKKQIILLYFFLLAALIASCGPKASGPAKNAPVNQFNSVPAVEGFVVKPTVVDQSIAISGTLKPFDETVLMPDVAGRVVIINVQEGKSVKQGTLLVKLFDGDLQASLKKSNAQLEIAEQTEKRQAELLKVSGISQSDYDQALLQVHSINEILKAQIRKTEIYAPFDGVIGLKNISIGAQVTPATPIATIRAEQKLKLDFSVPEKYGDELKPGLKVTFTVQGDDSKHEATVMATEEGIDASTRNLNARAVVQNTKALLKPGAFANVELQLKEIKNALMVPTQAIIPQELKKQLIVVKEGKANFVTVQTGVRQTSTIQVLSGVASGDTIVTTGILFLKPGMSLKFSKVNN